MVETGETLHGVALILPSTTEMHLLKYARQELFLSDVHICEINVSTGSARATVIAVK